MTVAIGWFMIWMGVVLAAIISELIRKNNERHK